MGDNKTKDPSYEIFSQQNKTGSQSASMQSTTSNNAPPPKKPNK